MVNIKARTLTLLSKVPVGWSNNLGKNIVNVTQRHIKNSKRGKDASTVDNNSRSIYSIKLAFVEIFCTIQNAKHFFISHSLLCATKPCLSINNRCIAPY